MPDSGEILEEDAIAIIEDGLLSAVFSEGETSYDLYPSESLYPGENLYPGEVTNFPAVKVEVNEDPATALVEEIPATAVLDDSDFATGKVDEDANPVAVIEE